MSARKTKIIYIYLFTFHKLKKSDEVRSSFSNFYHKFKNCNTLIEFRLETFQVRNNSSKKHNSKDAFKNSFYKVNLKTVRKHIYQLTNV